MLFHELLEKPRGEVPFARIRQQDHYGFACGLRPLGDFKCPPHGGAGRYSGEYTLLFREAPRIATSWFDSRSYLHGPMEALDRDRGLILVGDTADDGIAIIRRQAQEIGCSCVVITSRPADHSEVPQLVVPDAQGALVRQTLEMVALQVLTHHVSERLELTSGRFRYPQPQVKLKQAN